MVPHTQELLTTKTTRTTWASNKARGILVFFFPSLIILTPGMVEISCECFYVHNVVADMYSTSMVGSMLLQCLYRTHNSTQGDASKLKLGAVQYSGI